MAERRRGSGNREGARVDLPERRLAREDWVEACSWSGAGASSGGRTSASRASAAAGVAASRRRAAADQAAEAKRVQAFMMRGRGNSRSS
jgi:hypothetical protein